MTVEKSAKPNRRTQGTAYENQAAAYLESLGYEIKVHSFRCHFGEVDLIAYDPSDRALVFVEVKYRTSGDAGGPMAQVGYRKQATISKVANYYLHRYGYPVSTNCRFDVIGITPDGLRHIRNAFPYRF